MANYRQIHVSIWKDSWFLDLEPDEKLLFIYLFSNESTSLAGIYRISKKVIAFEANIEPERIEEILAKFEVAGKVYCEDDLIWIVNMRKYHETKSIKVQKRIASDVDFIPDCPLKRRYIAYTNSEIPYGYPIDTEPQLKEEEKEDEEEDKVSPSSDRRLASVSRAYEGNIGLITQMTADAIKDLVDEYPEGWILDAIQVAVNNNVRKLSYITAVLKNWKVKGRDSKAKATTDEDSAIEKYKAQGYTYVS